MPDFASFPSNPHIGARFVLDRTAIQAAGVPPDVVITSLPPGLWALDYVAIGHSTPGTFVYVDRQGRGVASDMAVDGRHRLIAAAASTVITAAFDAPEQPRMFVVKPGDSIRAWAAVATNGDAVRVLAVLRFCGLDYTIN